MKTLVISGIVLLLILSIYLFGFLLAFAFAVAEGRKNGAYGPKRWFTWVAFVAAFIMHLLLLDRAYSTSHPSLYFSTSIFAFIVCGYFSTFIGGSLSEKLSNWLPTAVFIFLTAFLPLTNTDKTADFVEITLRQFRVGGLIPVKVKKFKDQQNIIEGRLLLMTPKNLYITTLVNKGKTLIILRITEDLQIEIENG